MMNNSKKVVRPSNKIIALMVTAVLIIGSVTYEKYFKPDSSSGVLSYVSNTDNINIDADTLAAAENLQNYGVSTDIAFSNTNFSDKDNLTDRFSKTAFSTYVDLLNNGSTEEDAAYSVVSSLGSQASAVGNVTNPYSLSIISTFDDADKASIKVFGNKIATIEGDGARYFAEHNAEISKNPSLFANEYASIAAALVKVPVPKSLAGLQLQVVNSYADLSVNLKEVFDYTNDPLKGVSAMKQARSDQDAISAVYEKLSTYFKDNGIIFNKDEPGILWNN